jgi:hypothetical protein
VCVAIQVDQGIKMTRKCASEKFGVDVDVDVMLARWLLGRKGTHDVEVFFKKPSQRLRKMGDRAFRNMRMAVTPPARCRSISLKEQNQQE